MKTLTSRMRIRYDFGISRSSHRVRELKKACSYRILATKPEGRGGLRKPAAMENLEIKKFMVLSQSMARTHRTNHRRFRRVLTDIIRFSKLSSK